MAGRFGGASAAAAPDLVLSIDQGTSATKAVLVDASGAIVGKSAIPLAQHFPRPGWAEQDAFEIWTSVQTSVADCLSGIDPALVVAVGLSTQRESTLLWDRATGEPLGPVLGWQDTRGAGWCDRLRAAGHADEIRRISGLPLDAMFSAAKAASLLDEHDPDRTRSARGELCLGTVDAWLLWQLGAGHVTEIGNASRTQLLNIDTGRWDPWLLELFGVPAEALPTVVPSVGRIADAQGLSPLPPGTPVTGVLGDSHAALFAHAGWRPGRVKVTYGTGSSIMGITAGQGASNGVARTIGWQVHEPAYAVEGNIRSTGATLVWLSRMFGLAPADVAAQAAADSDGVFVVPAFTGLGAPWWDNQAQALISGLSEATQAPHLFRAGLESIAFQIEDVVASCEAGGAPIDVILADGGPSANPDLMQLQADTSGRRVDTSQVSELSALGAAHMAGLGVGLWTQADLDLLERPRRTYLPVLDDDWRAQRTTAWHNAVHASRTVGKGLAP